jgi:hypothetical protein
MRRRNKVAPRIPSFERVRTSSTDMPVLRAISLISNCSALDIFHSEYLLFQLCSHSGTRDATRVSFDENAVMASPVQVWRPLSRAASIWVDCRVICPVAFLTSAAFMRRFFPTTHPQLLRALLERQATTRHFGIAFNQRRRHSDESRMFSPIQSCGLCYAHQIATATNANTPTIIALQYTSRLFCWLIFLPFIVQQIDSTKGVRGKRPC